MSIESELAQQVAAKFTTERKRRLVQFLAVFIIGFCLGAWAMHSWYVSDLRADLAAAKERLNNTEQLLYEEINKPPKVKTETKTVTEFAYLPKETIIYKDPVTGKESAGQEQTDINMNVKPPTIFMQYNGKNFQMQGLTGESAKFESGKLIGEISTAATIDVTELVNQQIALQRESDKKVLSAKLNELEARKYRPQVDLIGGAGTFGGGIRVNRVGADYLKMSNDEKILLRYTILK